MPTPPADLSDLSLKETREQVGQLVETSLRQFRMSVLVLRNDGILTVLDPSLLAHLPPETMAQYLVDSWSEEQMLEFLGYLEQIKERLPT